MQFILTALSQMFGLVAAVGQIYKMLDRVSRDFDGCSWSPGELMLSLLSWYEHTIP